MRHPYFVARTVLVRNGNVDEAVGLLNRVLGREGIFDLWRHTRYFEKPTQDRWDFWFIGWRNLLTKINRNKQEIFKTRRRVNFMKCKAIYNEDMDRKIKFVMRKNRVEPFIGCH